MKKQSIDACLSEYTTKELIEFHANINALFLCCTEDLHLLPLVLQVHFAISMLSAKGDLLAKAYMKKLDKLHNIPKEYKYLKA